ncbi:signal transduction histidine kinase [Clostridium tetanomorphum]|uniref:histidine kinase n=1 Tax=Clostridium tetanomorphum TaxID=1553 RepID=A0A923EAP7_CLOTT|nr:HAMP domain-containing sensor histidine kinase [Clostridium tetanomorphum]KAJ53578.1 integral membrane sensor signal transduction histidine kinase [Clostridium tetanomorphum DSM 665]MBC2397786.1 HAMP domain-containing protein [Clostridium tetanomorphum]MBP1864613.1 signal transduction histidine kinase [Clostridium tetanomorphum]NRS84082.1 signal transduction histidine kinase [Clostridium tetanomorphum]NRZ97296.1 signal transduction histidine kinase [Clostridium tetanomorphum]
MNRSIRSKLFIFITFLLIFFSALLWILNSVYFQQYYINKKKNILIQNAKKLAVMYKGNVIDIQDELDRTANITGSNIDIINKNGKLVYNSSRRMLEEKNIIDNGELKERPKPPLDGPPDIDTIDKYIEGEYIFETRRDIKLKIDFLALVTKLSNQDILTIRVPLVSIKESVDIANKFVIITGVIIIIFGSAGAYIFSRKFTKPILELNSIAQNMAKFDFTQKCNISGKDEIGQLGKSVNHLSDELYKAITELNIKNQKLEKDIEKERKIDEMRKEFISSVSHELRTPLALIQGYAEGLISNVAESEEDRKFYCDVIMDETIKMNKLVRDLLNLSQIESGYFQIEKSEFDLMVLIKDVLNKYKSIFVEKNISIKFEAGESCIVYGDRVRIEQILINYVNNAINHVDENKIIEISKVIKEDKIKVGVFNTGKHIPKESLEKLWDSFYKVDKARTRAYGGYGLGLSIVKAIQELHNNEYGVENVQGGVNFWFEINRRKNKILD